MEILDDKVDFEFEFYNKKQSACHLRAMREFVFLCSLNLVTFTC